MTTTQVNGTNMKDVISGMLTQFVIWTPIVVGIIHQVLMFFFSINRIYVVLNPPGYIYPFVTLEFGWWMILTVISASLSFLAYTGRVAPHRMLYPVYAYLIFLLIFVQPI